MMKKLLSVVMALLLLLNVGTMAFAEDRVGGFLKSPTGNLAPEIVDFFAESADCLAKLVLTAFAERANLSQEERAAIEAAYEEIKNVSDVTTLCSALGTLAKTLGIPGSRLAVSDLFHLDYVNCDHKTHEEDEHGKFTVKLKSGTFKNFVGLMHYNNGVWELVEDAVVDENDILTFSVRDFSPFAVVVDTNPNDNPPTGDNSQIYLWGALAGISGAALVVCLVKSRKSAAKN